MQKIKKPVSILLSLIMALSLFTIVPVTAGAATQSGTDGNITWTFDDETGTLTISGTGEMSDYTNDGTPWMDCRDNIRSVVIEEGVTSVGAFAFYNFVMTEVRLPSTIKRINYAAFGSCDELSQIELPEGLEIIEERALNDCNSLRSITLPQSLRSIAEGAIVGAGLKTIRFLGTPKLEKDAIYKFISLYPLTINFEAVMQFDYQSLTSLKREDTVILYTGCTYLKNGEETLLTSENAAEVFGDAIVQFHSGADDYTTWAFDEITRVLTISGKGDMPDYQVYGKVAPWQVNTNIYPGIKSIVIEEGVTSVGSSTFYGLGNNEDDGITVQLPSTVTRIGTYAFGNSNIKEIDLPDGLVSIEESAFGNCPFESITFPSSLKTIGDRAFASCKLKSLTLPPSIETVGEIAFAYNNLETVRILGTPEIGAYAFYNSSQNGIEFIFPEARNFVFEEFYNLDSNDTVILSSGCTYLKNNEIIPLNAQNTSDVFFNAKVSIMDFAGHSISLNGDIGLNYYLGVAPGTNLHFEWYNKTYDYTVTADDYDAASGYYKVKVNVAAAEMNYPVTATCTYKGEVWATDTYSVRQYADKILDSTSDFSTDYVANNGAKKYGLLVDLIKKMLDYGAKAQSRFGVTDVELANTGVDYTMKPVTTNHIDTQKSDMTADLHKYGIDYIGTSIVFLSATTLRHYYVISDDKLFDKVKDSANFEFVDKGQRICFELKDIPAAQLDVAKAFTLGDSVYRYSVLDYCKLVIADESKPLADRELAMATYWYNDAAKAYFYANDEYEDDMI